MNRLLVDIKEELEIMRKELQERLNQEENTYQFEFGEEFDLINNEEMRKKKIVLHNVQADLDDIERALFKMDLGVYGICEKTGNLLPLDQLRILPTARFIDELSYERLKFQ